MAKNYSGIRRYQPLFPTKKISDVLENLGGGASILFEDGSTFTFPASPEREQSDDS